MLTNTNSRLLNKIKYTALILAVYMLGKCIPIPLIEKETAGLDMGMGFLMSNSRQSIFALDLAPWMSASIIMQMGSLASDRRGERTSAISMQRSTRLLALLFACLSAVMLSITLVVRPGTFHSLTAERMAVSIILVAGAFLTMWLAEQNKEKGIGGMVVFIFLNICTNTARIIYDLAVSQTGETGVWYMTVVPLICIVLAGIFGLLIFYRLEHREIRFPVQRVMIDSTMERQNYLAIKANPAGAQALMYVMAFYMLPYYLMMLLSAVFPDNSVISYLSECISLYRPFGVLLYVSLYIVVSVGLAYVQINPADIAEQMQKKGDCIKGLTPGIETRQTIRKAVLHSALSSALIVGALLGISLGLRILFPRIGDAAMLPVYAMILTGISQMIIAEIRTVYALDHYEAVLRF